MVKPVELMEAPKVKVNMEEAEVGVMVMVEERMAVQVVAVAVAAEKAMEVMADGMEASATGVKQEVEAMVVKREEVTREGLMVVEVTKEAMVGGGCCRPSTHLWSGSVLDPPASASRMNQVSFRHIQSCKDRDLPVLPWWHSDAQCC